MASGFEVVSQPVAVRSNLPIKVEIKLAVAGSKTFGRSQPQAYLSRARLIQLGHHNRYFSLFSLMRLEKRPEPTCPTECYYCTTSI
jgi:hypothetical protein